MNWDQLEIWDLDAIIASTDDEEIKRKAIDLRGRLLELW